MTAVGRSFREGANRRDADTYAKPPPLKSGPHEVVPPVQIPLSDNRQNRQGCAAVLGYLVGNRSVGAIHFDSWRIVS